MAVMETWKHGDSFASVDRSTTFLLAEEDLLSATANGKRGSLRLVSLKGVAFRKPLEKIQ